MSNSLSDQIEAGIADGIPGAETEVTLDGNRAFIVVKSGAFADMTRVAKQQAVYACIETFIADGSLHAVTIRAEAPDPHDG